MDALSQNPELRALAKRYRVVETLRDEDNAVHVDISPVVTALENESTRVINSRGSHQLFRSLQATVGILNTARFAR